MARSKIVKKHKLGFARGFLAEHDDGTVSYFKGAASLLPAFKVRVADVTGFGTGPGQSKLEKTLRVLGHGTEITSAQVAYGVPERIEEWFRARPEFAGNAAPNAAPAALSVADELTKLAALRDSGVITDEEFEAQKARLL